MILRHIQELPGHRSPKTPEMKNELWINEVLRINLLIGGINEFEFGYSQLGEILVGR